MATDYSILCVICGVNVKTTWVALFLCLLEAYVVKTNFTNLRGSESFLELFIIGLDVCCAVLFAVALFLKKSWLIIPEIVIYVLSGIHFLFQSILMFLTALFPEKLGFWYASEGLLQHWLEDEGMRYYLVDMWTSSGITFLISFADTAILTIIVYRVYLHVKQVEAERSTATDVVQPMMEM